MNLPLDTQFFLTILTVEGLVFELLVDNKNMARFVVLNRFISRRKPYGRNIDLLICVKFS